MPSSLVLVPAFVFVCCKACGISMTLGVYMDCHESNANGSATHAGLGVKFCAARMLPSLRPSYFVPQICAQNRNGVLTNICI